ncbi:Hypothetical protein R9X50_00425900 [Acrodontium crateriforme]|uniref:Cercosporin MFS transporter CTB4 n=1 Tax=Acrodontium crateriforme TaxID=150365 RepID=A0AAQ3M4E2_9PEZI|nr:Hypothetical protein R9X50_00425900 [Acrodontium crateriforme]
MNSTHSDAEKAKHDTDIEHEGESIMSALELRRPNDEGDSLDDRDLEKAITQPDITGHEPATKTMTAQDWDGPDDPENPNNWSMGKKAFHVGAVASLCFVVTAGSSMITPATKDIEDQFHVSRTAAILSLSLFVLGLGLGPSIAAPMSEIFGRAVVYKVTAPAYMLFIMGAGFSKTFGGLLVCRFLAGAIGGPCLAIGAGTNADLFVLHKRAVPSALYIAAPFLGPGLGPVVGGFAAYYKGYRWTQWCTIFLSLIATILVWFTSETYKKIILKKRAKRFNIPPPASPSLTAFQFVKLLLTITIFRPLKMLFTEPIVTLLTLYNSFTFSVLFAFFAAYPFVFMGEYHFNTWQYGLAFLAIALGVVLAALTGVLVDRFVYQPMHVRALKDGKIMVAPEHRLYSAMAGAFGVTIGLFWFAWTARREVHWIVPILAGIPFAWGNLCIFTSAAMYLLDVYGPLNGASAMAANGLGRYTMGAVFPLFTVQMYTTLGTAWATSLLGFLSILMLPIPFVFFKFGPKIRGKSQFNTSKA